MFTDLSLLVVYILIVYILVNTKILASKPIHCSLYNNSSSAADLIVIIVNS